MQMLARKYRYHRLLLHHVRANSHECAARARSLSTHKASSADGAAFTKTRYIQALHSRLFNDFYFTFTRFIFNLVEMTETEAL